MYKKIPLRKVILASLFLLSGNVNSGQVNSNFDPNPHFSMFDYLFDLDKFSNWDRFDKFAYDSCGKDLCIEYVYDKSDSIDEFHFLLALMAQETRFGDATTIKTYPVPISSAKALNYTQLMPCTALDYDLKVDPKSYFFNKNGRCVNNTRIIPNYRIDERVDNEKSLDATLEHIRWINSSLDGRYKASDIEKLTLIAFYRGLQYTKQTYKKGNKTFSRFTLDDLAYARAIQENIDKLDAKFMSL